METLLWDKVSVTSENCLALSTKALKELILLWSRSSWSCVSQQSTKISVFPKRIYADSSCCQLNINKQRRPFYAHIWNNTENRSYYNHKKRSISIPLFYLMWVTVYPSPMKACFHPYMSWIKMKIDNHQIVFAFWRYLIQNCPWLPYLCLCINQHYPKPFMLQQLKTAYSPTEFTNSKHLRFN